MHEQQALSVADSCVAGRMAHALLTAVRDIYSILSNCRPGQWWSDALAELPGCSFNQQEGVSPLK